MSAVPTALSAAVGERVRELRTTSGFSLDQLAKRAGLRAATLRAIEAGRARPSVATLAALAKPLRVTVLELVESASAPRAPVAVRVASGLDAIARSIILLPSGVGDKLDAVEAAAVEAAMSRCGGNRSAAARLLGMERKALIRRWQRAERDSRRRARKGV
jgi:transcriptional regulator with XRE-family HTH domain